LAANSLTIGRETKTLNDLVQESWKKLQHAKACIVRHAALLPQEDNQPRHIVWGANQRLAQQMERDKKDNKFKHVAFTSAIVGTTEFDRFIKESTDKILSCLRAISNAADSTTSGPWSGLVEKIQNKIHVYDEKCVTSDTFTEQVQHARKLVDDIYVFFNDLYTNEHERHSSFTPKHLNDHHETSRKIIAENMNIVGRTMQDMIDELLPGALMRKGKAGLQDLRKNELTPELRMESQRLIQLVRAGQTAWNPRLHNVRSYVANIVDQITRGFMKRYKAARAEAFILAMREVANRYKGYHTKLLKTDQKAENMEGDWYSKNNRKGRLIETHHYVNNLAKVRSGRVYNKSETELTPGPFLIPFGARDKKSYYVCAAPWYQWDGNTDKYVYPDDAERMRLGIPDSEVNERKRCSTNIFAQQGYDFAQPFYDWVDKWTLGRPVLGNKEVQQELVDKYIYNQDETFATEDRCMYDPAIMLSPAFHKKYSDRKYKGYRNESPFKKIANM
jgi:hypothetical protein